MKTYLVRSDNTEFETVRAKSLADACHKFYHNSEQHELFPQYITEMTFFVERNGKTAPMVAVENQFGFDGFVDKRAILEQREFDAEQVA